MPSEVQNIGAPILFDVRPLFGILGYMINPLLSMPPYRYITAMAAVETVRATISSLRWQMPCLSNWSRSLFA